MDGNQTDRVVAYVSRLTGRPVSADQKLLLRSVQRASLASWLRSEQIVVRGSLAGSTASGLVINELLLGSSGKESASSSGPTASTSNVLSPVGAVAGIGIDIEEIGSLPDTDDYREHPFYRDIFSPAEIAYCLRQPNVKASFSGTWAAKEAIVKSGIPGASIDDLKSVEIGHDKHGRPGHAGCILSISHTDTTAIAVCVAVTAQAFTPEAKPERRRGHQAEATDPAHSPRFWRMPALLTLAVVLGGVIFLLTRFA